MPRIKTKNSTTSTTVPTSGSLLQGEVAINIADKRLFVGDSSGNPVEITNQGVTSVFGSVSGIYVTQATGSTTIGLDPDVFVSGSLHVSGVLTQSPAAINIFASEDSETSESRMINMRSFATAYAEINVADEGTLILKNDANTVQINPTGTAPVYLDTVSSTGYLYTTPTDIRIGGSSAVTTFPGDVTITKTLTVDHINGELDGAVLKACKNTDSIALRKGDPVFIAGTVGATDVIEVQLARSDTAAKMPAIGLVTQALAVNATGHVTVLGTLTNVDTSAFTVGNSLFIASTGWLTNVRPTGASILVQNIGRAGRINASNGQIIVLGPGRTNDVPNNILASGTLTLGTPDIITPLAGTASVFNTNVARVNIGSSASGVHIGHATGVVTVGDLAVNDGAISTTAATATLFDTTATTVTIGSAATTTNIAATTAAQTINIGAGANAAGVTKTINIGTGATLGATTTNITLGPTASSTGTITINGRANVIGPYATGITIGGLQLDSGVTATGVINIGTNTILGGHKIINIGTNGTFGSSTITIGNTIGGVVLQGSVGSGIIIPATVPLRLIGTSMSTTADVLATGVTSKVLAVSSVESTGFMLAASGYRINSSTINAQTATGYTLQASDNGRIITFDSAATHTLRIPTGLDIGFNATVIQLGTGQVTCTGLSGATVNCYASGNKILGQHGSASIICYASNTYNLGGTLGI